MSRIHRILSKAERDGTASWLTVHDPARRERREDLGASLDGALEAGPAAGWPIVGPSDWGTHPETMTETSPLAKARPIFGPKLNRLLVAALDPFSPGSEGYRALRTRIGQLDAVGPRQVMAITSPGTSDGKSLTSANLALTMAQEFRRRILLIDADLRHARLHSLLGIPREPGLTDVLTGSTPLEDALVSLPEFRLMVLPAGTVHDHPTELLASVPMRRLIEGLRQRFHRLLLDTAPAPIADAGVVAPLTDGLLLVVRAGWTKKSDIEQALNILPASSLLGLVMNESRSAARTYSYSP
jgi:protein-tyrosine kinase